MMHKHKQGFTIVEMLMVIGVLAILMGIVTTASSAAIRQARDRRTQAVKNIINMGISTYRSQRDCWPPEKGQLDKWSSDGISSDTSNGVNSGKRIAFLSAEQYDDMMYELAKVSVGKEGASPMMDFTGMTVATKSAANAKAGRGIEFREAIKKNKKHGSTISLRDMVFGYQEKESGRFRRFIVQYNQDSDSVVVMTKGDFDSWWSSLKDYASSSSSSRKYPSGYNY